MKYLMILIMALTISTVAVAGAPTTLPADRTTLGEVWTYICEDVLDGRYHNDSGIWACTNDTAGE